MQKSSKSQNYIVDRNTINRFDEQKTIFGRILSDEKADFYKTSMYSNSKEIIKKNRPGYTHVDFCKAIGAWTVYDYFHEAFSWDSLKDPNSIMTKPNLNKYKVNDINYFTEDIKKTAVFYGADLVGITKLNDLWVYSKDKHGKPVNIPDECKYVIVMAIKMNSEEISKSPSFNACAETGRVYSKMAFCIGCMAEFIRNLGYKAIPMGNDTALSIPLAIDAGLGQLGRNGLLITPEYGSCVRICKVFTNLPLKFDIPKDYGIIDFCIKCRKCSEACEANAISKDEKPSFKIQCASNNPGVKKWAVDHEKCYNFWIENGGDCSNCISSCPYTKNSLNLNLK